MRPRTTDERHDAGRARAAFPRHDRHTSESSHFNWHDIPDVQPERHGNAEHTRILHGAPVDPVDLRFRAEFPADLCQALRAGHVVLTAPRRTGKTSVMDYLRDRPATNGPRKSSRCCEGPSTSSISSVDRPVTSTRTSRKRKRTTELSSRRWSRGSRTDRQHRLRASSTWIMGTLRLGSTRHGPAPQVRTPRHWRHATAVAACRFLSVGPGLECRPERWMGHPEFPDIPE